MRRIQKTTRGQEDVGSDRYEEEDAERARMIEKQERLVL